MSPKRIVALAAVIFLTCVSIVVFINSEIKQGEQDKRRLILEKEGQIAARVIGDGIQHFAALVSGIRSYIQTAEQIPNPKELQKFLNEQVKDIEYTDSLIVNYLDQDHVFMYTIARNSLILNKLTGTTLKEIRTPKEISRLDQLMESDNMKIFPPLNLVEGWVGIPLVFRVKKEENVKGYFAPIINFKYIIDRIYEREASQQFVYHFSTEEGIQFDRSMVYNGDSLQNHAKDPESFKAYDLSEDVFTFQEVKTYGFTFRVGVGFKDSNELTPFINPLTFGVIYLALLVLSLLVLYWTSQTRIIQSIVAKNKELSAAYEMLNQYSFASSHSLKEQIRTVGSFSTLLKKRYGYALDENGKKYIDYISQSSKRMSQILIDLKEYSQVVNVKDLYIEKVNLNEVLNEALESSIETSPHSSFGFNVDHLPNIKTSRIYIYILFQHLLSNGLKFNNSEVPQVTIRYKKLWDTHEFRFEDNGIGVPKAYQKKIFEPFQQLDKETYPGSGFGLSVCQQIVAHLNGAIYTEPHITMGSTFVVSLPENEEKKMIIHSLLMK